MPSLTALTGLPSIARGITLPTVTPASVVGTTTGAGLLPPLPSPPIVSGTGTSASASHTNLLPYVGGGLRLSSEGVYVGDGVPPVPEKLASKIRRGEFVEMGELLPEFWSHTKGEEGEPSRETKSRKTRKVTDIFTWIQCFGTYVSVRTPPAPHLIPEFMAYMATIVRVSQDYAGLAWVRYDAAFRRQAALTGNTRWSVINSTLYTISFTGMAAVTKRCELCFATGHTERECAQRGDTDPDMRDRLKAIESAVLAMAGKQEPPKVVPPPPPRPSGEPCRNYPRCRHSHSCSVCGGAHPASKCAVASPPTSVQPKAGKHFFPPNRPY